MTTISLPRSAPEAQGVSSKDILAFIEAANDDIQFLHSFMLLRHGHVIAEGWWSPYQRDLQHMLFSLSKSFTSTAIGFAVQEGLLGLDDAVIAFFPEDAPAQPSGNLKAMKLRHILSMSGGQDVDSTERAVTDPEGNWVRGFLSAPVPFPPGTHFVYNSAATYMCSAILQKVTGQTLMDFLTPRLFEPLGIEGAWWQSDPRGVNVGGWGLNITTEDIAKFGQFYLQKGVWQGRRLLSEAWIDEATSFQVDNAPGANAVNGSDWQQGYGFQFWRCQHNAYRGDGAFGQYCVVMPEQDAVIAITAGLDDMQAVLTMIWDRLLPAMQAAPLPADETALVELQHALQTLSIPLTIGAQTSAIARAVNNKPFAVEPNPLQITSLRFSFAGDGATLTYTDPQGEHALPLGIGRWAEGELTLLASSFWRSDQPMHYAGSGAWQDERTFTGRLVCNNTTFIPRLTCAFNDDRMSLNLVFDRSMGPAPEVNLAGYFN